MSKTVFEHAFERDICLTALEDQGLGARVLRRTPVLDGLRWSELIAAGRLARSNGRLKPKLALKLASALVDIGLAGEAAEVLQDEGVDVGAKEVFRQACLARAMLVCGDAAAAGLAFERAAERDLGELDAELFACLSWALDRGARPEGSRAARLAQGLCVRGLADPAAKALAPIMAQPDGVRPEVLDELIEAAFGVLRLAGPGPGRTLIEAMAPIYDIEGRTSSFRAALATLDGGADQGDEPEPPGASARRLLLRACLAEACAAARLWPAAIRRLDFAGKRGEEPGDALCELARCVGQDLLGRLKVELGPAGGPPKVIDLFAFNGEFAMLQLKLREMAGWTDRFVLVEAEQTFTGLPKRLYFQEQPNAGGAFADQITHIVVPAPPDHIDFTWAREFFQKDCALLGLAGASPDDLVLLSDVDEIIDRAAVEGFDGDLAPQALRTFKYFINFEVATDRPQLKSAVTRARFVAAHGWDYLRLGAGRYRRSAYLARAGWHFTSIGDPQWLARKMQCTAHEEWSYMDRAFFEKRLRKMRQGGYGSNSARREIDESFPASIRESREALADFIL